MRTDEKEGEERDGNKRGYEGTERTRERKVKRDPEGEREGEGREREKASQGKLHMAPCDWLAPVSSDRPPSTPIARARRAYVHNTLSCSLHIVRGVSGACMQRRTPSHRCTAGKVFVLRSRVMNHHYHRQHRTTIGITVAVAVAAAALLPLLPPPKKLAESLAAGTKWGRVAAEGSLRHAGEERTDDMVYIILLYRETVHAREGGGAGKGW